MSPLQQMDGYTNLSLIKEADDIRKVAHKLQSKGKNTFGTLASYDPKKKKNQASPRMRQAKFKLPRFSVPSEKAH
jgi:hypothetical protein